MKKKLKVLWLLDYPIYEFPEELGINPNHKSHSFSWAKNLLNKFVEEGDSDIHILSFNNKIQKEISFTKNKVTFHFLKTKKYHFRVLNLFRKDISKATIKIKEIKPDIIHVHGTETFYGLIPKRLDIPYVISIQGIMKEIYKRKAHRLDIVEIIWFIQVFIENIVIKSCSNFLVRTHFDSAYISKTNSKAILYEAWEFINPIYSTIIRKESTRKSILFLGGTLGIKGLRTVLKAFHILSKTEDIDLYLGGSVIESVLKQDLKLLPEHLHKKVIVKGQLNPHEIAKLYESVSVVVNASVIENSSNVICECQISEVPIVATNVGGTSSLIENGKSGFLYEVNNPMELANKLSYLFKHPDEVLSISKNAKNIALLRHDREINYEKYLNCYHSLTNQTGTEKSIV